MALPVKKLCFLCDETFMAEWAKKPPVDSWYTSFLCHDCEAKLDPEDQSQ